MNHQHKAFCASQVGGECNCQGYPLIEWTEELDVRDWRVRIWLDAGRQITTSTFPDWKSLERTLAKFSYISFKGTDEEAFKALIETVFEEFETINAIQIIQLKGDWDPHEATRGIVVYKNWP